jgi:hypothetical protein
LIAGEDKCRGSYVVLGGKSGFIAFTASEAELKEGTHSNGKDRRQRRSRGAKNIGTQTSQKSTQI